MEKLMMLNQLLTSVRSSKQKKKRRQDSSSSESSSSDSSSTSGSTSSESSSDLSRSKRRNKKAGRTPSPAFSNMSVDSSSAAIHVYPDITVINENAQSQASKTAISSSSKNEDYNSAREASTIPTTKTTATGISIFGQSDRETDQDVIPLYTVSKYYLKKILIIYSYIMQYY